jgi:hypothetical protein
MFRKTCLEGLGHPSQVGIPGFPKTVFFVSFRQRRHIVRLLIETASRGAYMRHQL